MGNIFGVRLLDNLYVGSKADYEDSRIGYSNDWLIIHACKSSHQKALGYHKALPKDDPRYYLYKNRNHIYMNIVDVPYSNWFNNDIMHEVVSTAVNAIHNGINIYVHCDQGESRSPMIGLLILKSLGLLANKDFDTAFKEYKYPNLNPKEGIYGYCKEHWNEY